jgi:hypothetical protein
MSLVQSFRERLNQRSVDAREVAVGQSVVKAGTVRLTPHGRRLVEEYLQAHADLSIIVQPQSERDTRDEVR